MHGGMLFQCILYVLLFLLCVVLLAKIRKQTVRQAILLLASYALYMTWGIWPAAILVVST